MSHNKRRRTTTIPHNNEYDNEDDETVVVCSRDISSLCTNPHCPHMHPRLEECLKCGQRILLRYRYCKICLNQESELIEREEEEMFHSRSCEYLRTRKRCTEGSRCRYYIRVCKYWKMGYCAEGDRCRFLHPMSFKVLCMYDGCPEQVHMNSRYCYDHVRDIGLERMRLFGDSFMTALGVRNE